MCRVFMPKQVGTQYTFIIYRYIIKIILIFAKLFYKKLFQIFCFSFNNHLIIYYEFGKKKNYCYLRLHLLLFID